MPAPWIGLVVVDKSNPDSVSVTAFRFDARSIPVTSACQVENNGGLDT
jgi:hypothetical protein